MAGLIFLFGNVENVTVNIDEGYKPALLIELDNPTISYAGVTLPNANVIEDILPALLVEMSEALFTDTDTLVNDPVFLVNDPNEVVGGSDIFSDTIQISAKIGDIKPSIFKVGDS